MIHFLLVSLSLLHLSDLDGLVLEIAEVSLGLARETILSLQDEYFLLSLFP